MIKKTITEIEDQLRDLHPEKELAYLDYLDNTGDISGLREHLWDNFENLQDEWNKLVNTRKELLGKGDNSEYSGNIL